MSSLFAKNSSLFAAGLIGTLTLVGAAKTTSSERSQPATEPSQPPSTHIPVNKVVRSENNLAEFNLPAPPPANPPPLELGPEYKATPEQLKKYQVQCSELDQKLCYVRKKIDHVFSRMSFEEYKDLGYYLEYPGISGLAATKEQKELKKGISKETLEKMHDLWMESALIDKLLSPLEKKVDELKKEFLKPEFYCPDVEERLQKYAGKFQELELTTQADSFDKSFKIFMLKHGAEAIELAQRKAAILSAHKK